MPTLNAEKFVAEAVESILGQTFTDFEFIIINDGSTDRTAEILETYRARDSRIRVYHQSNAGGAAAMNWGCQLARGQYVARMDADDVSLPPRLAMQVAYLERHPEVRLCGTWMHTFADSTQRLVSYPTDPDVALCSLLFRMPFVGGSIVFDRTLYSQQGIHYSSGVGATDDYLFIVECAKYGRIASLPEVLYRYRSHPAQVTKTQREQQHRFARLIRLRQLEDLGLRVSESEISVHEAISTWEMQGDRQWVKQAEDWLVKLQTTNLAKRRYPTNKFAQVLADYWFAVCTRNSVLGSWVYETFLASPLTRDVTIAARQKLKFRLKCLLGSFFEPKTSGAECVEK
jgi:glycosyltransferase involved in cell wall biosynthesis